MQTEQGIRLGKKRISLILKKLKWRYGSKVEDKDLKSLKELPESQVGRFQVLRPDLGCQLLGGSLLGRVKAPLHQSSKKVWPRTRMETGEVPSRFAASTTLTVATAALLTGCWLSRSSVESSAVTTTRYSSWR